MNRTFWSHLLIVACLLFPAGCGGGMTSAKGKVSGKVMVNGEPLILGSVNLFSSETGVAASVPLTPDGTYAMTEGIDVGKYQVTITPPSFGGDGVGSSSSFAKTSKIPEKYRSLPSSDLQVEVKKGENSFDFDLK